MSTVRTPEASIKRLAEETEKSCATLGAASTTTTKDTQQ